MGLISKKEEEQYPQEPQTTDLVPIVPYKVLHSGLPFFSDPECQEQVEKARICILLALDPEDRVVEPDIVPTFGEYPEGAYVAWSLDSKKLWEGCWFRNPETAQIEKAWNFHVLFTGAVIAADALEAEKERIQQQEAQTFKRMKTLRH